MKRHLKTGQKFILKPLILTLLSLLCQFASAEQTIQASLSCNTLLRTQNTPPERSNREISLILALQEINQQYENLKASFVKKLTNIRDITQLHLGRPVSGSVFNQMIRDTFNSWEDGLKAAGLFEIHTDRMAPFWTEKRLKEIFIFLNTKNIPPTRHQIRTNQSKVKTLTKAKFGKEITLSALDKVIPRLVGDWKDIPTLTGIEVSPSDFGSSYWSPDLIIECLQKAHAANFLINADSIRDNNPQLNQFLQSITQNSGTSGGGLYEATRRHFGQYSKALAAAGFDPFQVELASRYWTADFIINSIWALDEQGLLPNSDSLVTSSPEINKIISSVVGKTNVTGAALMRAMQRIFGSFNNAFSAAGIDYTNVSKGIRYWSPSLVVKTLKKLHQENLPLDYTSILNASPQMLKIIQSITNVSSSSGHSLIYALTRYFKTPVEAFTLAGLDPNIYKAPRIELTRNLIIEVIKALHIKDAPLDFTSMSTVGYLIPQITEIISNTTGRNFSTRTILLKSIQEFGDWRKALIAADIDPNDIYLKGTIPVKDLPEHLATQRRLNIGRYSQDHISIGTVYVNNEAQLEFVDNRLPEDSVAVDEMVTKVTDFAKDLNKRENQIYRALIEAVDSIQSFEDLIPNTLNSGLVKDLTEAEVISVLSQMKEGLVAFQMDL